MAEQEKHINPCFPLTRVSFCIDGDDLVPESMTEQLGFPPTTSWRKGEVRQDRDGNRYYEKHQEVSSGQYASSHWCYSTEYEQVHDIMQPISLILERFVPLLDILIRARVWTQFTYHISIAMKRVNTEEPFVFPEMILSYDVIAFADAIGAEISFDLEGMFP